MELPESSTQPNDRNNGRQNQDAALLLLVAQCSATPATVVATPPCSATPFQTQISVRHLLGGRCDTKIFRGCSATPVLHLQNAIKSRTSAATRVARDRGYPQSCATKLLLTAGSFALSTWASLLSVVFGSLFAIRSPLSLLRMRAGLSSLH